MAAINAKSSALIGTEALSMPKPHSKTLSKACGRFEKRICPEISLKNFLDFLHTAYQINEAIEGVPNYLTDRHDIDWQNIAMNEFASSLLVMKEDNSHPKTSLETFSETIDKEVLNSSLTKQSKTVPNISSVDCNELEENVYERTKEIQSDASSEISEHDIRSEVSKNSIGNKTGIPIEDIQNSSNLNDTTRYPLLKEEMLSDLKKPSNQFTTSQTKSKLLMSGKYTESKRKTISSKKCALSDCKFKTTNEDNNSFEHLMKRKLNEVIQEGLFDSILPYVVPKQSSTHPAMKKPSNPDKSKAFSVTSLDKSASGPFPKEKVVVNNRKKSISGEAEVEIHVCDEVKNVKRDFRCPQKLLVNKMGYFAEVTTGQKLEDMDISVHCDITIFDWLMRWVKKDSLSEDSSPKLDAGNVVPILVSAAFLQMDPLLQDCLVFCHQHMNEIAKTSTNLACLNDSILTRDPSWNLNDYIRCLRQELKCWRRTYWRLWGDCHFLYCSFCHNYFPVYQMQWCYHHPEPPQFFTMEHQRAMAFPIGRYPCCGERAYRFEVFSSQSGCQFKEHTLVLNSPRDIEVHNLFMKHQNMIMLEPPKLQFPERLTRLVSNREPGRDDTDSREVLWWDGVELAQPPPRQGLLAKVWETHQKKERQQISGVSSRNNSSSSSGTNNVTSRPVTTCGHPPVGRQMSVAEVTSSPGSNPDVDNSSTNDDSSSSGSSSSSSDSDNHSEESGHVPVRSVTAKPRHTEVHQYYRSAKNRGEDNCRWVSELSVRSNQDNQREYEEHAIQKMAALLTRRTCADSSNLYSRMHSHSHGHHIQYGHSIWNNHIIPQGGIYVRLEQEWRDANCLSHGCHGNSNRPRSVGWGLSSRIKVRAQR
ncbi:uncharacterized protein KIAA1841 homolog isoform X2 [Cryptotermes secundus]|uniref:uncharacterized protein KIAA1841 homolog isoform X2 n=1 Tax=Cryptotermes secundus TaxID=105785 RepID=UPI001454D337|nr:uncharacterized protein KIAA1841 homolog isoform X2 [Cryptotermes secundus]